MVQKGGYDKTDEAIGRSNTGSAWEVMEIADVCFVQNVENNGESKMLMIKAVKRRDMIGDENADIIGIRHPFISTQSFALTPDLEEPCAISIPIYSGKRVCNYLAAV